MEPAQKRQRCQMSTMQRLSLLPNDVQVGVLMWAMEPMPTAAIMKAAIGDRYGNPGWWADLVDHSKGYERFLNYHRPCLHLWARVLEERNGFLEWKWSKTNVLLNAIGGACIKGSWDDLTNEMVIRRNTDRTPPVDKFLHEGRLETHVHQNARALYVNVPKPGTSDDLPQLFRCTRNRVMLAGGNFRLDWHDEHLWRNRKLYEMVAEPMWR